LFGEYNIFDIGTNHNYIKCFVNQRNFNLKNILLIFISCFFAISCAPVQKHKVIAKDDQFFKFLEQEVEAAHQTRQQKMAIAQARQQKMAIAQAQLQELSTFQAEKKFYHLKVNTRPLNSTIKVMNIKPKYRHNMSLAPGKYDILVQKKGYKPKRKWIEIIDRDLSIHIALEKELIKARKKSYSKKRRNTAKKYRKKSSSKKLGRNKTSKSACPRRKSCSAIRSCKEAYRQLRCGNRRLDRDKDGVPCESICPGG
jgi:hypothetical protein